VVQDGPPEIINAYAQTNLRSEMAECYGITPILDVQRRIFRIQYPDGDEQTWLRGLYSHRRCVLPVSLGRAIMSMPDVLSAGR